MLGSGEVVRLQRAQRNSDCTNLPNELRLVAVQACCVGSPFRHYGRRRDALRVMPSLITGKEKPLGPWSVGGEVVIAEVVAGEGRDYSLST